MKFFNFFPKDPEIAKSQGDFNQLNPRANQYASITTTGSGTVEPLNDFDGSMKLGPLPATPAVNSTLRWDAENRLVEVLDAVGTTSLVK